MNTQELIEVLEDLKHDLGKYLVLPVAMLDDAADAATVRAAVDTALHHTRRGPFGSQSARALWEAFQAEAGAGLASMPLASAPVAAMADAVARALAWHDTLAAGTPIDRAQVLSDFRAVGQAIGALLSELGELGEADGV